MAVGDLDLSCIEVRFVRPGDTEVGGIDVDAVRTEFGRKEALGNDFIE